MVDKGDLLPELGSYKVAEQGHQRLKAAEPQAHKGHLPHVHLPQGQALTHRHGKGVHREPHRHQKQFQQSHSFYLQVFRAFRA